MSLFKGRQEAGEILAGAILTLRPGLHDPLVLGIPRGGIPVGYPVAEAFAAPLDALVLRKLPIPDNPEAGFGAVTLDKMVILNKELVAGVGLSRSEIGAIADTVYKEVLRRNRQYRGNRPFPEIRGRSVIVTDDGLASGFTMLAAIQFIAKRKAKEVIVAVPVAHDKAYEAVRAQADKVIALHISDAPYFAVASFYDDFPDMTDEEVKEYLEQKKEHSVIR